MKKYVLLWQYLAGLSVEFEEKIKTDILRSKTFSENLYVCWIMWENTVQPE